MRIARVTGRVPSCDLAEELGCSQTCVRERVRTGGPVTLPDGFGPGVAPDRDFLDHYRSD